MGSPPPPQPDERTIIDTRPHPVYVVVRTWRTLVFGLLTWVLLIWMSGLLPGFGLVIIAWVVLAIVALRLLYAVLDLLARRHVLTDQRLIATHGVFTTVRHDIALDKVQHLVVVRPLVERLFGVGSIGASSAGTSDIELVWRSMENPREILETIRAQLKRTTASTQRRIPIIGIAGGVASGKSRVARAFESIGCVVSDSDAAGKRALTREDVKRTLIDRWGDAILATDGSLDRAKIAAIVFNDEAERKFLESVTHPIIHDDRARTIEQARKDPSVRAVIIDAPLLFEAGIDDECDAVVFVDTPREIRLDRVKRNRNWDESELDRRENAQLPLETKRQRSDHVIANGGDPQGLPSACERILGSIERSLSTPRP
jgi:dephospho-CoA kinase